MAGERRTTMGFFRNQEEQLAKRFITWQFEKKGMSLPGEAELTRLARQVVDDAHRIARERGRNVVAIIKELVDDIKKK